MSTRLTRDFESSAQRSVWMALTLLVMAMALNGLFWTEAIGPLTPGAAAATNALDAVATVSQEKMMFLGARALLPLTGLLALPFWAQLVRSLTPWRARAARLLTVVAVLGTVIFAAHFMRACMVFSQLGDQYVRARSSVARDSLVAAAITNFHMQRATLSVAAAALVLWSTALSCLMVRAKPLRWLGYLGLLGGAGALVASLGWAWPAAKGLFDILRGLAQSVLIVWIIGVSFHIRPADQAFD